MNIRKIKRGVLAAAFGVGLLVACFCPTKVLITVLALIIICLGISCTKC